MQRVALTEVWPSGWSWGHGASHYLAMIIGLYATLGVFRLLATRDPLANRSLIWFTVVSSVVHAVIMAVQALSDSNERGHLNGRCACTADRRGGSRGAASAGGCPEDSWPGFSLSEAQFSRG